MDLLQEALDDSDTFHEWKNKMRAEAANRLGPIMMEIIRTQSSGEFSNTMPALVVMAEAMGDMLAQASQKIAAYGDKEHRKLLISGLAEQIETAGQDYIERTE